MQTIKFTKEYKFAHGGYRTEEFVVGQEVDASDELAECAIADGVAKRTNAEKEAAEKEAAEKEAAEKVEAGRPKADRSAPKNASSPSAPEIK